MLKRVDFDPSNAQHRIAYLKFVKEGRWDTYFNCPYPWISLPSYIERTLTLYFLEQVND